jgi:dipeptidyl aminopeptidase/acylaminoacyl peptidase
MTKRILLLPIIALTVMVNLSAQGPESKANYRQAARFSPIQLKKMVFSSQVDPHWLKKSDRFWYPFTTGEGKSYFLVDPAKSAKQLLFDNAMLAARISSLTRDPFDAKNLSIKDLKFSEDENLIRFEIISKLVDEDEEEEETDMTEKKENKKKENGKANGTKKKTWFFEYNLQTRQLLLLDDYEKPKDRPKWANISPDGEKIVFVRHHNLYWMDKANYEKALEDEKDSTIVEHQITTDGEKDYDFTRTYGKDNVELEKEKDDRKPTGIYWSPDSELFALTRSDERQVKDLWVVKTLSSPRPTLETYKYQLPGEKEAPIEELMVVNLKADTTFRINVEAFKDQRLSIMRRENLAKERDDDYVATQWKSGRPDKFYFSRTSRDLKRVDVCEANPYTGEVKVLIEERLNTYIDLAPLGIVNNSQELIFWSERDGWGHFYLYDGEGKLKNQITSGPFHCEEIKGVDEKNRVLYFTANGKEAGEDPYYKHLYRINFDGSGMKLLTPGNFDHSPSMNDNQRYIVNTFSRVNTTPQSQLLNTRGEKQMALETADLSLLFEAGYHFPETFKVKADDGLNDLYGVMYKPFDFDSTKQYPIILYVYPGPQTEAVNKTFSTRMDRLDRLAQLGFVVITVGNRGGHPARSKWYHTYGYGNLRNYGLADKKHAVEQLADRHSFIDINRVGIHGHSGGGFMSTAAMLVYPDFFKVAVSNAGNHENNIYNRWWSEKHHGVEEVTDTAGNVSFKYNIDVNSSLANNLKGHLLLTMGEIDNNVHPGNTIRMANALIRANKRFDLVMLPGQRHGYGDMTEYFFWRMADYFSKYLLDNPDPGVDITEMNREKELTK